MDFNRLIKNQLKQMITEGKLTANDAAKLLSLNDFFQFAYEVNPKEYTNFRDFYYTRIIKNSGLAELEKENLEGNPEALKLMEQFFYMVPRGVSIPCS